MTGYPDIWREKAGYSGKEFKPITMSSTEVLSAGSIHDYSSDYNHTRTPQRKRLNSQSSEEVTSDEIQDEIDELMFNVPELKGHFTITNKIGSGTFSSVYTGKLKKGNVKTTYALKYILPTSHPSRIASELRCLKEIGGCDNVIGVNACVRHNDHVVIIMPYFPHDKFQDYIQEFTVSDTRQYMYNLFIALRRVHEFDVIHRDVKPSNFLYNRKLNQYSLVDFGLAQKAPVLLREPNDIEIGCKIMPRKKDSDQAELHTKACASTSKFSRKAPVKRKLNCEATSQSPSKRRPLSDHNNKPKVKSQVSNLTLPTEMKDDKKLQSDPKVVLENSVINLEEKLKGHSDNVVEDVFKVNSGKKSPRRMLLTKRTMQMDCPSHPLGGSENLARRTSVVVGNGSKMMYRSVTFSGCKCFGKPMVCSICMARSNQNAPRAGTPGFRSPEVLMKYPDQTTAVDIWSAGVIFLSLLSGRYPFFKANDDLTALAQIISVFGTNNMKTAARSCGKELTCSPILPALDLKVLCYKLRGYSDDKKSNMPSNPTSEKDNCWRQVPDSAYDLLSKLMALNPKKRITAEDALKHPFFTEN